MRASYTLDAPPPTWAGRTIAHTLLLSVDFEDWHQLARRRLGVRDWQSSGPALTRQTHVLLELLDELHVHATFFVLGLAARSYPELVTEIAERGHEIACHGDMHELVHTQTPAQFAADVQAACGLIEQLTGTRPRGYRAPAFSITQAARWAYDVLADQGFAYDSSQHDSPRIRGRIEPARAEPHPLALEHGASLWEFPLAVARLGGVRLPVGGASYWAMLPRAVVLRGLASTPELAGLYLHPNELDPQRLEAGSAAGGAATRGAAALRQLHRNLARRRAPATLRAIASRHRLITYREAHAELCASASPRP